MTIRYTSPTGNDTTGDGSLGNPYATWTKAVSVSSAGDAVEMMAGTYYRADKPAITADGSAGNPITIRPYQGGTVRLSGAIPTAVTWVFDAAPNVWKTNAAYFNTGNNAIGGWSADHEYGLLNYKVETYLRSTLHTYVLDGSNHNLPIYQGPGLFMDTSTHIWYCRLEQSTDSLTDEAGVALTPPFATMDPNAAGIIPFYTNVLYILSGATYLTFQDLIFSDADTLFQVKLSTHDITFDHCTFNFRGNAVTAIDDTCSNIFIINGCNANGGVKQDRAWTDVKGTIQDALGNEASQGYPEFQSTAFGGLMNGWQILDSTIRDTFDCVSFGSGSVNSVVRRNQMLNIMDDCIDTKAYNDNADISYNILWGTSGISILTDDAGLSFTVGDIYFYQNKIAVPHRRYLRVGDTVTGGNRWDCAGPIGSHGNDAFDAAHLKAYNNTIIARASANAGTGTMAGNFTASSGLAFYNNIFYTPDDRQMFRYHTIAAGAKFNGNLIWRPTEVTNFCTAFADGVTRATWAAYQAAMIALGATGWELDGDSFDPGFNTTAIFNANIDVGAIDSLFRPSNALALTVGSSETPAYPGFTNAYRGALDTFVETLTLQPGESTAIDTYLREGAPTSGSATDTVISSNPSAGSRRPTLMRWDLSSIPAGSAIVTATLYLYSSTNAPASDRVFAVHLILAANSGWVETATWNAPFSGGFWAGDSGHDGGSDAGGTIAGTDYQTTASATFTYASGTVAGTEKAITLAAADVIARAGTNLDLRIRRTDAVSSTFDMHSSSAVTAAFRPKLVVTFVRPVGAVTGPKPALTVDSAFFMGILSAARRRRAISAR